MRLVVFGANGPTGRQVVEQALASGHQVAAVTRKPDEYPLRSTRLDIVAADVTDEVAVRNAVDGADAVISTYGVPYGRREITVYSQGITHITRAMAAHGVSRLVCVSSTTVATEDAPSDSLLWRKVFRPLLRNSLGRTLYDDMERMERIVQGTDLVWTVVRPGGLFDLPEPTPDYQVAPHRLPGRLTSRADLAQTLVHEATEPLHPRETIEVITRSGMPPFTTFLREAFGTNR